VTGWQSRARRRPEALAMRLSYRASDTDADVSAARAAIVEVYEEIRTATIATTP
jgi:hypothetical protein